MRKPAFCIFLWPSCSDIILFIDRYCAGASNKHCSLPFFICYMIQFSMPKLREATEIEHFLQATHISVGSVCLHVIS